VEVTMVRREDSRTRDRLPPRSGQQVYRADHVPGSSSHQRGGCAARFGLPLRIRGHVRKLKLDGQGKIVVNAAGHIDTASELPAGDARGVAFLLDNENFPIAGEILNGKVNDLWILLRGDFVLDSKGKAVDVEFARAELPTGDHPNGSVFGVQGGLFESWFTVKAQG
jgi:hypothetical protein